MLGRTCLTLALFLFATICLAGCATAQRPTEAIRESADHYFRIGDFEAARDEYAEIVSRWPGDWHAQYRLGLCFLETGELSPARRALEIAYTRIHERRAVQPRDDQDVANALAEAMFRQGDESRLFAFLRERASSMQTVETHRQLGRYSMEMNDPDSARVAFDTAIQIDGGLTTEPYIDAAMLAERLGQLDEAIRRLRQAYGIKPEDRRVTDKLTALGENVATITPLPPGR